VNYCVCRVGSRQRSATQTHLGDLNDIARLEVDHIAVGSASNAALVERHDVLRQRARFVGENVLDLSQLLVERRRASSRIRFALLVQHLFVPIDLERLDKANHLNGHVQRDRHDRVEDNRVREEDEHADDGGALDLLRNDDLVPRQELLKVVADEALPDGGRNRAEATNGQQEKDNLQADEER
jgi:hypothetical protein